MSFFLFVLLVIGGFVVTVMSLVFRTFHALGAAPQSNSFKQSLARMQQQIEPMIAQLVPWEPDTLSLLAARPSTEKSSGLFIKTSEQGIITTIYQEPVACYSKSYIGQIFLLLVRTKTESYLFRKTNQQTEVWLNDQPYCVIVGKNILSADRSGKLLAQLEGLDQASNQAVLIKGQTVASLLTRFTGDEVNPRALQAPDQLNEEATTLLKVLAFNQIAGEKR